MKKRYNNPILPGFYPDPSICRVEDDYYLVHSTFSYFPGVPIFHSKDLIHWKQIGNVLTRNTQLNLSGAKHSEGVFAPTLRYHNGTFYMVTTNVSSKEGNFIVTARRPEGPWSDPYVLDAEGIDPSLFFDDDGRCYYCGTKPRREGAKYYGDNEIYIRELDLDSMSLIGDSYPAWHGALRDVVWPEGPHLYKKDGWYYLLISEAGTGHEHAVTIARSKSLTEPFMGYNCNPILTHRHLGRNYPIVNVGHPDIVETGNGEWWMVLLASRPYGGYYRNLGRETFLVPLVWENGWPVINPGVGVVEEDFPMPDLPETPVAPPDDNEEFNQETLPLHYMYLRNPKPEHYSLTENPGHLRLALAPERITQRVSPSFVCRRQTSKSYSIETLLSFQPKNDRERAGLVLLQSNEFHYQYVLTMKEDSHYLTIIRCKDGKEEEVKGMRIPTLPDVVLRVTQMEQDLEFTYRLNHDGRYHVLADRVDARILSTDVAGGFVGTCLGVYASSNGQSSTNYADFDYFRYEAIPEKHKI